MPCSPCCVLTDCRFDNGGLLNISEQVIVTKGVSTGFDYLRIILSVSVIAWHTVRVCYGPAAELPFWQGPFRPIIFLLIPSFFALSGFLVAGSLQRVGNLPVFLTLRVLRIFPALCCEVLMSALIIGPLLTDLPLWTYFSSPMLHAYFLNIVGNMHFFLPGVFTDNPSSQVNLQLWTIPSELLCYLILATLSLLTITRQPRLFGLMAVAYNLYAFGHDWVDVGMVSRTSPSGPVIVSCFLWGVFLFIERDKIRYDVWLCVIAALAAWCSITWTPATSYLAPLPIAYVTMFIGLQNPGKIRLIAAGDFSYGVYLYGFPIQQTVARLLPDHRVWYIHFPASLTNAAMFAWLSWTMIESPILVRKGRATRFVDTVVRSITATWGTRPPAP